MDNDSSSEKTDLKSKLLGLTKIEFFKNKRNLIVIGTAIIIIIILIITFCCIPNKEYIYSISPLSYGLREAKNGIERYQILLKTHQEAKKNNTGVNYCGIKRIDIEIPENPSNIPLTDYTDFCGVTIHVLNQNASKTLYSQGLTAKEINMTGNEIDTGNISSKTELKNGTYIIYVEDETLWVANRKGYSYGHTRKDMLLVDKGKVKNKPVSSYSTNSTVPKTTYIAVTKKEKIVKNLIFERDAASTKITYLFYFTNQYNVHISNIKVTTPNNDEMADDAVIQVTNSVHVIMNDVTVNGTYSQYNRSGYGLSLNNVYDLQINRMWAHGKWGVFGTNNLNKVFIKNSNLNRFDIHCYGRDIASEGTKYSNVYNQFSSIFGYVSFKDCSFTNSTPVSFEGSYNAYSFFNLYFKDCKFYVVGYKRYIISGNKALDQTELNSRPELKTKYLPLIKFDNFQFIVPENVTIVRIYSFSTSPQEEIKVDLSGIKIISNHNVTLQISN